MNVSLTSTLHEQITPEFLHALDAAIAAAETAGQILVSLDPLDRIRLRPFGPSNEAFVPDVIEATTLHANLVPAHLGATEIAKRRTATVELLHRLTRLEELLKRMSDTARVTGDSCVALALNAYQLLKQQASAEGIEATVDRLARRFEANVRAGREAAANRRAGNAGTTTPAAGGSASPAPSSGSASNAAAPNVVSLPASGNAPLAQAA